MSPLDSGRGHWTRRVLNPFFFRLGISSSAVPQAPIHANSRSGRLAGFMVSPCDTGAGAAGVEVCDVEGSIEEVDERDFAGY